MTPLTPCQTQHKIPITRETTVAVAHAEAKTVTITTTNAAAAEGVTAEIITRATLGVTIVIIPTVVKKAPVPTNSALRLHANTHRPS